MEFRARRGIIRRENRAHRPAIRRYFPMKIIRAKDYYDMSRKAANIISAQVIMKPNCVLGLAPLFISTSL